MAGGRFDKLVGKVRPGTYINFESGRETDILSAGTRGTVIVPLPKAAYGPAKQFIRLTNASPDAEAATLGYIRRQWSSPDMTGRRPLVSLVGWWGEAPSKRNSGMRAPLKRTKACTPLS